MGMALSKRKMMCLLQARFGPRYGHIRWGFGWLAASGEEVTIAIKNVRNAELGFGDFFVWRLFE